MYKHRSRFTQAAIAATLASPISPKPTKVVLSVALQGRNGWLFTWPGIDVPFYRVVLQGQQIDIVVNATGGEMSYLYEGPSFIDYPPPLEIIPSTAGLAMSEINKPFMTMQWYGVSGASYYQVQEFVGSDWVRVFEILEIETSLYSWTTQNLADESTHHYRVLAFNSLDREGTPVFFDITPVVTPPNYVETDYSISYNDATNEIVLDLA